MEKMVITIEQMEIFSRHVENVKDNKTYIVELKRNKYLK